MFVERLKTVANNQIKRMICSIKNTGMEVVSWRSDARQRRLDETIHFCIEQMTWWGRDVETIARSHIHVRRSDRRVFYRVSDKMEVVFLFEHLSRWRCRSLYIGLEPFGSRFCLYFLVNIIVFGLVVVILNLERFQIADLLHMNTWLQ